MKKFIYFILCLLFISCRDNEVVFTDVDIIFSVSISDDLDRISNIKTVFNTPLESGIISEKKNNNKYEIEINNVKCPTNIDFSVIFERNESIQIIEDLKIKKSSSYKIRRNFSDGSFLEKVSVTIEGITPSYNFEKVLEFFKKENKENLILHLDKEGN